MSQSPLLILIPAYNEEMNLCRVVGELERVCPQYDYLILNDGSTDGTARLCREHGFPFLDLPVNLGLAGAFAAGMRYACRRGYEYAIQIDGDGQHDPGYIDAMLVAARDGRADIVIGSRFLEGKKPHSLRMAGSRAIEWAIRLTTGKKLTDPTSGMRMYSRRIISYFAGHDDYQPEPDTVAFLMRCGARTVEVPVVMRERIAGTSYLNLTRSAAYMIRVGMSVLLFQWFIRKAPLEEENRSCR